MEKNLRNIPHSFAFVSLELNWWAFAWRGILSIIVGGIAIFMPLATTLFMSIVFGCYSIIDGIFSLVAGINQISKKKQWGGLIANGIMGIIAGLIALVMPHIVSLSIAMLLWVTISLWAISRGVLEIITAMRLRLKIEDDWSMILSGVFSLVLGLGVLGLLWVDPLTSLTTLGLLIGANLLASGLLSLLLASKLRKLNESVDNQV